MTQSQYPSLLFNVMRAIYRCFIFNKKGKGFIRGFFSFFFHLLVCLRNFCYERKIFKSSKNDSAYVLSVGNIALGGTGKTQIVDFFLRKLKGKINVAVISRGYKGERKLKKFSYVVKTTEHSPKLCGDEPYMIAKNHPEVPVIVGVDRLRSLRIATKELGRTFVLMDDGFQYRKLEKDFDLVVVKEREIIDGSFFPKGYLRDQLNRLKQANLICVNGSYTKKFDEILSRYTEAKRCYFKSNFCSVNIIESDRDLVMKDIRNVPIGIFCALGDPKNFISTVEDAGGLVVAKYILPDHKKITEKELKMFSDRVKMRSGKIILCSQKDIVKLEGFSDKIDILPVGYVEVDLFIEKGEEFFNELVGNILAKFKKE